VVYSNHTGDKSLFLGWQWQRAALVFLYPNWSLGLCKLLFGTLQTAVSNYQKRIITGLTKYFQACDNFLSS